MSGEKKTYLALYERRNESVDFLNFTTMIASVPPKPQNFSLKKGFTGKIIIFEVREVIQYCRMRKPAACRRCGSDDIGMLDSLESENEMDYEEQGGRWYCIRCGWQEDLPAPKKEEQ